MLTRVRTTKGTVKSVYKRAGDRNPKVEVRGVELTNGQRFETCSYLNQDTLQKVAERAELARQNAAPGAYITRGHAEFENPHDLITEIAVGSDITVFYGNTNGYPHPTFVGFE